jgi:hypothetical protein
MTRCSEVIPHQSNDLLKAASAVFTGSNMLPQQQPGFRGPQQQGMRQLQKPRKLGFRRALEMVKTRYPTGRLHKNRKFRAVRDAVLHFSTPAHREGLKASYNAAKFHEDFYVTMAKILNQVDSGATEINVPGSPAHVKKIIQHIGRIGFSHFVATTGANLPALEKALSNKFSKEGIDAVKNLWNATYDVSVGGDGKRLEKLIETESEKVKESFINKGERESEAKLAEYDNAKATKRPGAAKIKLPYVTPKYFKRVCADIFARAAAKPSPKKAISYLKRQLRFLTAQMTAMQKNADSVAAMNILTKGFIAGSDEVSKKEIDNLSQKYVSFIAGSVMDPVIQRASAQRYDYETQLGVNVPNLKNNILYVINSAVEWSKQHGIKNFELTPEWVLTCSDEDFKTHYNNLETRQKLVYNMKTRPISETRKPFASEITPTESVPEDVAVAVLNTRFDEVKTNEESKTSTSSFVSQLRDFTSTNTSSMIR